MKNYIVYVSIAGKWVNMGKYSANSKEEAMENAQTEHGYLGHLWKAEEYTI